MKHITSLTTAILIFSSCSHVSNNEINEQNGIEHTAEIISPSICFYENLSKEFNFKTIPISKNEDLLQVTVEITEKENTDKIQTIKMECNRYWDFLNDCENVKSYSTKINNELPTGHEHDSGNLIIADFNFDGLEDFAIKNDEGGNGGPLYTYFIQDKNKNFHQNSYLTDTVKFFPIEINMAKKTITTLVHANAYQNSKRIFKYSPKTEKWNLIYSDFE